ncbi:Oidioi.mRNA.OKI2018_I69.XSR.g13822.t2.cds [Oikopleura dioica]|uniref:Oidioi.mRNA.OKI2018_I69.XSR.g13822.t2.cds n=1 Tax=Oikopleura dioica TaxID=34765 RepID=A0ABN7SE60_OIKDI|nr:Oidioi.mRNA.OKI2018_I69.XSR.g13822.t2.cds [Oikopleura dioica]
MEYEGLEILLKSKHDLEVETIAGNLTAPVLEAFPKTAKLIDSPFSGLQIRLKLLAEIAQSASESKDLIVSADMLAYSKLLLEQAVVFAISPNLSKGIGIPVEKRLKMHEKSVFKVDFQRNKDPSAEVLHMTLESMYDILTSKTMFAPSAKRLSIDILCACIQLGFGRKNDAQNDNEMFATREQGLSARRMLLSFCDSTPLTLVFQELCLIMIAEKQSEGKWGPRTWFRAGCKKIIQRCMKQENALSAFLDALMGPESVLMKTPQPISSIKLYVSLAGPLDSEDKFEEMKILLEGADNLEPNQALFLSVVIAQQKLYKLITFDEDNASSSMRRIKTVLQCLPKDSDIGGLEEVHQFAKKQTKVIYQYAIVLGQNCIEGQTNYDTAFEVLQILSSTDILSLVHSRAEFSYNFDFTRVPPKPFNGDVEIRILAELIRQTSRNCRLDILVDLLKFSFRSTDMEYKEAYCLLLGAFLETSPEFVVELMNNEENIPQILTVCELIFPHADDSDLRQFILSIVALLLSDLVGYSLATKKQVRERMAPIITQLIHSEENAEVLRTAKDILTKVLTFGQTQNETKKSHEDEWKSTGKENLSHSKDKKMTLRTWAEYLDSNEIPLRSGAIRELTSALQKNALPDDLSEKLEKNCMLVLQLKTEPFLFLSAVEALCQFALKRKEVFDHLVDLLRTQASRNPELAVQIGEVLSRTCKGLGDMAPCYATTLIPVLLSIASAKNLDNMIIASAISTASDLLPLCKFLLHDIQYEVGAAIVGFLSPTVDESVQKSACEMAKQIFTAIGPRFSTFTDGIVLEVYRALKKIVKDPLTSKWLYNSAALALESVDQAVKDYLTPSQKMEKKIQRGALVGIMNSAPLSIRRRACGINPRRAQHQLECIAEDHLVRGQKTIEAKLPDHTKSTYAIAFSACGKYCATSTGDHNVHVIERATGKLVKTLTGHPRTCWSVVFHPKNPKLIASADLSGEVRVWCVDTGEGPVWRRVRGVVERETNRVSVCFHPRDNVLAIGISNELHLWDWWEDFKPFVSLKTGSDAEKYYSAVFRRMENNLSLPSVALQKLPLPSPQTLFKRS